MRGKFYFLFSISLIFLSVIFLNLNFVSADVCGCVEGSDCVINSDCFMTTDNCWDDEPYCSYQCEGEYCDFNNLIINATLNTGLLMDYESNSRGNSLKLNLSGNFTITENGAINSSGADTSHPSGNSPAGYITLLAKNVFIFGSIYSFGGLSTERGYPSSSTAGGIFFINVSENINISGAKFYLQGRGRSLDCNNQGGVLNFWAINGNITYSANLIGSGGDDDCGMSSPGAAGASIFFRALKIISSGNFYLTGGDNLGTPGGDCGEFGLDCIYGGRGGSVYYYSCLGTSDSSTYNLNAGNGTTYWGTNGSVAYSYGSFCPPLTIISPLNSTYENSTQLLEIGSLSNNTWYNWNGTNVSYTNKTYVNFSSGSNFLVAWSNNSGIINSTNVTFTISPSCEESIVFTEWSDWVNLDCIDSSNRNQSRYRIEYDENSCGTFEEVMHYEYLSISDSSCSSGGGGGSSSEECEEDWECTEWSACLGGEQTRTCTDLNDCGTNENKPETLYSCGVIICNENWVCDWTICSEEDDYSYPINCYDTNNCGTFLNKLNETKCNSTFTNLTECVSNWQCSEWSECDVDYSFDSLEFLELSGISTRLCNDLNNCEIPTEEVKECVISSQISVSSSSSSSIEIKDKNSGSVLSIINVRNSSDFGLDILLNPSEKIVEETFVLQDVSNTPFYFSILLWISFFVLLGFWFRNEVLIDGFTLRKIFNYFWISGEEAQEIEKSIWKKFNFESEVAKENLVSNLKRLASSGEEIEFVKRK